MAVSAKFQADYSTFLTATQAAESKLRSFEEGAAKAGNAVQKMANSLSGTSVIQQATVMAEAVERVGGVSKLTERELARVSSTATEAANKLRAMGQDVPPAIQKIANAANNAGGAFDSMKGIAGSMAAAFGIAFSVGAVVNFGRQVFASASHIKDLSSQLGISTKAVQGFKFAAEQSGSSLDAVGTAITKMNANLAGGDKATIKALSDAGLQFNAIRAMKPEDAFLAISDAIRDIPDPMTQSDVALQVFGRSAAQLLPGMKEGFRELADSASKMSDDTIKRLEEAEDAWDRVTTNVTIWSGELIAATIKMFSQPPNEDAYLQKWLDALHLDATKAKEELSDLGRGLDTLRGKIETLTVGGAKKPIGASLGLSNISVNEMLAISNALDDEREAANRAAEAWRRRSSALSESVPLTAEQVQVNNLLTKAKQHEQAAVDFASTSWRAWEKAASEALKNVEANSAPLRLITRDLSGFVQQVSAAAASSTGNLTGSGGTSGGGILASIFGSSAQFGQQWAAGFANSLSGAIQGWQGIGSSLSGFATNVAKDFASTALSFVPGIGPILQQFGGPIVDGLKKLFGGIFGIGTAGRDTVKDFVAQFGGFDAFHEMLGKELPADAERYWIALTQGVGRNNPEQAKRVISDIEAALARQKTKTEEAAAASAEAARAQQDELDAISKKYSEVIDRLDSEYKTLSDSIGKEAEEEFKGLTQIAEEERLKQVKAEKAAQEAMRDAEIAAKKDTWDEVFESGKDVDKRLRDLFGKTLEIPYRFVPEDGFVPGTSTYTPPVRPPASQTPLVEVHSHSYLDGREVAVSVARTRAKLRMS